MEKIITAEIAKLSKIQIQEAVCNILTSDSAIMKTLES